MTMPGDDGTYIPAGTQSPIPKVYPNSPQLPLQTTFPTQVPSGVLPSLAATAGTGHFDGSSGIMSALLSEDTTGVGSLSDSGSQDMVSDTLWPAGGRGIRNLPKEDPYENGMSSPIVTRFVLITLFSYQYSSNSDDISIIPTHELN